MRVLVTRPADETLATARQLASRGHDAMLAPVTTIEALDPAVPDGPFDALLATSARAFVHAPAAFAQRFANAPLHVVGRRTAAAATAHGFATPRTVARDAAALAGEILLSHAGAARFLYLAGRDRSPDLEVMLEDAGHSVEAVPVYAARALAALPADVVVALIAGRIDAALHFSRRGADIFVTLVRDVSLAQAARSIRHIAISERAATPLRSAGFTTEVAVSPDSEALFAALDPV